MTNFNLKQATYLRQVMISMNMMLHAHRELNKLWDEDSDNEIELNDYLARLYPFDETYQVVVKDISIWVESLRNIVHGFNTCHIHAETEYDELCPICNPEPLPEVYPPYDIKGSGKWKENADIEILVQRKNKNLYYVIKVWGDVEPELSVPSNTVDERDSLAKQMKKFDREEEGEDYSGFYWLDIIDGKPEIGSYSGAFFDEDKEEPQD